MASNKERSINTGFRFYTTYTTRDGIECIFAENSAEERIINSNGGNGGMLTLNRSNKSKVMSELEEAGHSQGDAFIPE